MSASQAYLTVQSCLAEGGPFTSMVAVAAVSLGAIAFAWFLSLTYRAQSRREDLGRIRDLLIEGSIGQAILLADKRAKDPLFAVVRAAITTVQATKSRDSALARIDEESKKQFGRGAVFVRFVGAALIIGGAAIPLGIAIGGQAWARTQITKAAIAMRDLAGPDVDTRVAGVWEEGLATMVYECPRKLGIPASLLLLFPALILAPWEIGTRTYAAKRAAVNESQRYVEMAARVLDPSFRVYQKEAGRPGGGT